jgi:hypothetical protein
MADTDTEILQNVAKSEQREDDHDDQKKVIIYPFTFLKYIEKEGNCNSYTELSEQYKSTPKYICRDTYRNWCKMVHHYDSIIFDYNFSHEK